MKTYELFEKALYKVTQKNDEASHSFSLRMQAAFDEIGQDVKIQDMQAFVMLRQSNLSSEDKKRILSMTNGVLELDKVDKAMRSLSTRVLLGPGEVKKKVYPVNYTENEETNQSNEENPNIQSTYAVVHEEEDVFTAEHLEYLVGLGDEDALTIQAFERDFEEMMQEIPDLQTALVSYQDARQRIADRRKSRGFWPTSGKSRGKGSSKDGYKSFRKGGKSGKDELLARIARTHCKACGALGHWKAECPQRQKEARETANLVQDEDFAETGIDVDQVLFEAISDEEYDTVETCLVAQHCMPRQSQFSPKIQEDTKRFWVKRLNTGRYNLKYRSQQHKHAKNREDHKSQPLQSSAKHQSVFHPNHPDRSIERIAKRSQSAKTPIVIVPSNIAKTSEASGNGNHAEIPNRGMAILDTGASRSVIGDDHVPIMLQKLPEAVRSQVKEQPSCIGFRFGNNQIAYSYKQLRIPLIHGKMRMWILVEVAPKATPFLLSIKTMKSLGAVLDLDQNTCYLKTMGRSLYLKENKNGLFMIDMSDLCRCSEKPSAAAFIASSNLVPPPGLEEVSSQDAYPPRGVGSPPCRGGRSDDKPSDVVDSGLHSHEGNRADYGIHRGSTEPSDPIGARSECPEAEDQPADGNSADPIPEAHGNTRDHHEEPYTRVDRGLRLGSRAHAKSSSGSSNIISGPNYFPSTVGESDSTSTASSSSTDAHEAVSIQPSTKSTTNTRISRKPSFVSGSTFRSWKPTDGDTCYIGIVGCQNGQLGKEAHRQDLQPCVRDRSGLRVLGERPNHISVGRNPRFRPLCTGSSTAGNVGIIPPVEHKWETLNQKRFGLPKFFKKDQFKESQLDLLEVYTSSNSMLTTMALHFGLRAQRFSKSDGDLSTPEGRRKLLDVIERRRPKHIWMSPECGPWGSWSNFNANRSLQGYDKVMESRQEARKHLVFCNLIAKIQREAGRHAHLENPKGSALWEQKELRSFLESSIPAFVDQCAFGLRHPDNQKLMQKPTRIQTTSIEMFQELDQRFCRKNHEHHAIAGTCFWMGRSMPLSRYAAFYPRLFAKAILEGIFKTRKDPYPVPVIPVCHVESLEEPPPKRAKTNPEPSQVPNDTTNMWKPIFERLKTELPKSGIVTWTDPQNELFQAIQTKIPHVDMGAIKAGKGFDKMIIGENEWKEQFPIRYCILMKRFTHELVDMGHENWGSMSKKQANRHAQASHIMLCIFSRDPSSTESAVNPDVPMDLAPNPSSSHMKAPEPVHVDVPAWTPLSASVSGPNFQKLSSNQQSMIKKIHNNLGHPTAERLARHLKESKAHSHLVDAAAEYVCPSCAERHTPQKTTPGQLKDPKEFNERIHIDGFDWKSKSGTSIYVLHVLDDATRFHLGQRIVRDAPNTIKMMKQSWIQWAGAPQEICHDQGGEFVSQSWKDFLQTHGIQPIVSAAPWQRGRIERHGGIIKEMMDRVDHERNLQTTQDIEDALQECFRAKNSMISNHGYSPEQAVLGKATKLPGSLTSDESTSTHHMCFSDDPTSNLFKRSLDLRVAARAAFWHADNNAAIRRAALHRSRGTVHEWACGQLCMFWDKRKAPNMLEKGRWCGPAQIVCQESRTIVWITHMNRLLRCAHENLRPVSMREFHQYPSIQHSNSPEQLQQMAEKLKAQLKEKSGMFQFSDLADIQPPEDEEATLEDIPISRQPEEEPIRRASIDELPNRDSNRDLAVETPVPDSPISSSLPSPSVGVTPSEPRTETCDSDESENEHSAPMEPVYNVTILENCPCSADCVADDEAFWSQPDPIESACVTFEFEMPKQQFAKFTKNPKANLSQVENAARKFGKELVYNDLTQEERERDSARLNSKNSIVG